MLKGIRALPKGRFQKVTFSIVQQYTVILSTFVEELQCFSSFHVSFISFWNWKTNTTGEESDLSRGWIGTFQGAKPTISPRIGRSYGFPPTTCARKQLYVGHGHGSQHSLNAFRGKVFKKNPMVGTRGNVWKGAGMRVDVQTLLVLQYFLPLWDLLWDWRVREKQFWDVPSNLPESFIRFKVPLRVGEVVLFLFCLHNLYIHIYRFAGFILQLVYAIL